MIAALWHALAIVLLCVLAAVVYGVIHDQITARICIEYFTIGHPPVFHTQSPTLLGLGWGVIATWWVGLILGTLLAGAARIGRWPRLSAGQLLRPLVLVLIWVGLFAMVAGVLGYVAATNDWVHLTEPLASRVPADRHVRFIADLWIHLASYAGATLGGIALCLWTLRRRAKRQAHVNG